MPKTSIIISTYNQPKWLQLVLIGYQQQTEKDFELLIADDGSGPETINIIDDFTAQSNLKILHLWQEDNGFQKNKILNKAIVKANSEYLIFTDGDCIPRYDFVETHLKLKQPNTFLSGGYFKLTKAISQKITREDIINKHCFDASWLVSQGQPKSFKLNKLKAKGLKEWFLNTFTPTKATWDGMNASGWKSDLVSINGFDERMQYGGEDRELGERLINKGVNAKQVRYSAICLHLYHERSYRNDDAWQSNLSIRKQTKLNNAVWTDFGINKTLA